MKKPNFKRYTTRQLQYYAHRAFWILFSWVLVANLLFFYEYFTLKSNGVLSSAYDFKQAFVTNLIVAVMAGLIGGIVTVNLMERWLRIHAFWKALLYIIITYFVAAILISAFGGLYFYSEDFGLPFYHPDVLAEMKIFMNSWFFLKNVLVWLVIVISTLIILMVNDKYGPGVFPDYLMGRYFSPKKERRIFMFADLKNATGIAEALVEEKYFNFLKDFFRDIAPAIVQTHGEVYQYVGDEIVVTWKMKWGIKNANALQCYYSMRKIIKFKAPKYLSKYDTVPEFRVGYHFGSVMVGEIGQIKRDIAFSGDVLNTASRIKGLCSELDVDILASKEFANIAYKLPKNVVRYDIGKEKLRGKADEIELATYRKE